MKTGFTKRRLAEIYQITDNPVYQTIKACGLDTSKQSYTEEEIRTRFDVARKLLETKNYSYKDIEAHFAVQSAKDEAHDRSGDHDGSTPSRGFSTESVDPSDMATEISHEIALSMREMVKDAVSDLVQYLPQMSVEVMDEAYRTGQIRDSFAKFRSSYVAGRELRPRSVMGYAPPAPGLSSNDHAELGEVIEDPDEASSVTEETEDDEA